MTAGERELIRRAVVRYAIDGSEDFGQVTARLTKQVPGRSFPEILAAVDKAWRRERLRRGE